MRIDKVNLDLYVAIPDMLDGLGLTAEQAAIGLVDALRVVTGDTFVGTAIQTAESLTEDEWLAAQAKLAQGCGHCEGCKAAAAIEGEWAEEHGFVI